MIRRTASSPFLIAFILLIVTCSARALPGNDDWPSWGGPNHNFTVKPDIIKSGHPIELKTAWKKPLGSGYSAVSVFDGMAVTIFSDSTFDYAVALSTDDGSEIWRFKIDSTFLGRYGSDNGSISTPLISEGKIVGLSATGRLFALERKTGKLAWDSDLITDHQAKIPFYGFTSSPVQYGNVLLLQTGGTSENAISAFDIDTGKVLWSTCSDTIDYQSPYLLRTGSGAQFIGITDRALYGLKPETGDILWTHEHKGDQYAMGIASANLVATGENSFFLKNSYQGGIAFKLGYANEMFQVDELWQSKAIKRTYIVPVYHDGYLFGYNSRIFNCVDAATGERVWRSREPGDGLPIVVDGHLVVITKDGRLSVAPASPDGYNEIAGLDLLDSRIWSPASIADGRLFLRSMTEIAAVDIVPAQAMVQLDEQTDGIVDGSQLARLVSKIEKSDDKTALVDEFMAAQKEFPVIEGDNIVHFIYRGEANDMALLGDLVGWRYDRPMHRVSGTDLFYYSARLEPDTRLTYKFMKDLEIPLVDSLNSRFINSMYYGPASWFSMPGWKKPDYLEVNTESHGRIDSLQLTSDLLDSSRTIGVYLPAGYDNSTESYPVVYLHDADNALKLGNMVVGLDNLVGSHIRPVVVVFIPRFNSWGYGEYVGYNRENYAKIFINDILPQVETRYRILPGRDNRLNAGQLSSGFMAFYSTFKHRDLFGKLAIQSLYWDEKEASELNDMVTLIDQNNPKIYLDWGAYDLNSPNEGVNLVEGNRKFAALLKDRGFDFTGGEVKDGTGWGSWKNRIDRMLGTFFPVADSKSE